MSQIYYQKKLVPRIQVTAEDMRRYYDQYRGAEFSQPEKVRFRLIKITVKQVGDPSLAKQKIEDLRKRKGPDADQPHRVSFKKLVRA